METTLTFQDYQCRYSVEPHRKHSATILFYRYALKWCVAVNLVLLCTTITIAQVRSSSNGNWANSSTWVGGTVPKATDNVIIEQGHHITITGQANCATIELISPPNNSIITNTELRVSNGASLTASNLTLRAKNDRRNSNLINNGGTVTLSKLVIEDGCLLDHQTGVISSGDIVNSGNIVMNTATLEMKGNYTYNLKSTFTKGNGTVIYAGTAANQTIAPLTYHNLQLTGNSTKITTTGVTVLGNLLVEPGTTFAASNYSHTITGDLINRGTVTSQAATVTINGNLNNIGTLSAGATNYIVKGNFQNNGIFQAGTSAVTLQGSTLQRITGNTSFYNLTYNGTAGGELLNNVTVLNNFTINNSHLKTGEHTLTLGQLATITTPETDTSHVIGNVRTTRSLAPNNTENFGNIGITLSRNETDPGLVIIDRLTGISTQLNEEAQSIDRQYSVSRVDTTTDISTLSMNMEFNFLPKELKSKPLNEYTLYRKNKDQEATLLQSTIIDKTTLKHSGANKFGTYTLAARPTPLPVKLVSFQALNKDHQVVLKWQTASEQDNKGFEIQVSTDGKVFAPIRFIASKNGYSATLQDYSYTDVTPAQAQTRYYRLKQIDNSGTYNYSPVKMVRVGTKFSLQAFPNPFSDHLQLYLPATHATLKITDVNGKVVSNYNLTPAHRNSDGYFTLQTEHIYKQGMYILTVIADDQIYTAKLLKH